MTGDRKPAAFRLAPEPPAPEPRPAREVRHRERHPRAMAPETVVVATPAELDVFDNPADPVPAAPLARHGKGSVLGRIFLGATGILVSLALGLWIDDLVRTLFARAEWLGWAGAAIAAVAISALVVILAREALAIRRLASVAHLQERAAAALASNDPREARGVVAELQRFTAGKPETAAGRRVLAETEGEVIDAADLLALAETEILGPLDAEARRLVMEAGKRVSIVTAVSPRALVDVAYVVFESGRLIRRLAELYGGRPGTLGFFRLARSVLAHLAVTGSLAAGDSLVQQLVGHGLAARLSAKLGEGVVNGAMTMRIGIAAMETARPLPFRALRRPGIGDFLSTLTRFAENRARPGGS
jgi:putative membrane protein